MALVSHEDFVVAWTTSSSLEDVIRDTKMTKAACSARANMLRKAGVRLKKMPSNRALDNLRISQLNSLINKHSVKGA
jgi:hypothetical protein